ncbi:hypothetical protein BH09PLA1_BH09PLA1_30820 [soil metagenome]
MNAGILSDSEAGRRVLAGSDTRSQAIFTPRSSPGDSRIATLDAARLVALIAIIFIHTVEAPSLQRISLIGTFGVPFYLFASLYFQARSIKRHPQRLLQQYIIERFQRLYIPFLAWTAIYLLARNAKHLLLVHDGQFSGSMSHLWTGGAHHLWFLPLLFVVTIFTAVLGRLSSQSETWRWRIIAISAMIGTILAVVPRPQWLNYAQGEEAVFYLQCWKALPSVFLGLSLAWWLAWDCEDLLFSHALGFAGMLLTIAMLANQIISGYSRIDRTLSGLGWLLAAMAAWRGPWVNWMASVGRKSYGVYLAHVLVIEAVQTIAHRSGIGSSIGLDLFTISVGFSVALAITMAIARSSYTRWINGD